MRAEMRVEMGMMRCMPSMATCGARARGQTCASRGAARHARGRGGASAAAAEAQPRASAAVGCNRVRPTCHLLGVLRQLFLLHMYQLGILLRKIHERYSSAVLHLGETGHQGKL